MHVGQRAEGFALITLGFIFGPHLSSLQGMPFENYLSGSSKIQTFSSNEIEITPHGFKLCNSVEIPNLSDLDFDNSHSFSTLMKTSFRKCPLCTRCHWLLQPDTKHEQGNVRIVQHYRLDRGLGQLQASTFSTRFATELKHD